MTENGNVEIWSEELKQNDLASKGKKHNSFFSKLTFALSVIGSTTGIIALALVIFGVGGQNNTDNRPDFENQNGAMMEPQNQSGSMNPDDANTNATTTTNSNTTTTTTN